MQPLIWRSSLSFNLEYELDPKSDISSRFCCSMKISGVDVDASCRQEHECNVVLI